ncbi:MAG: T9SS type A sorting domain-containing protein [Chitinophagaceae bacterium]|nr:MAG: T9SS type A sorting domain-containing protein [Chitinophagaceae bacterium]
MNRGINIPPYRIIDETPFSGNNFYRIKQVDKDGSITYSNIINVYVVPKQLQLSVYPNPVDDIMHIRLNQQQPGTCMISLTDMNGRTVFRKNILGAAAGAEIRIDMSAYSAQLYMLVIRNNKNEIIATQRVIKN